MNSRRRHVGGFDLRKAIKDQRCVCVCVCDWQEDKFGMYALYSKNKPRSDALLTSHGNAFFKVGRTHV